MNIKCLPYNHRATVALADVAAVSVTPAGRASKPAPPGKVQVNGNFWPNGATYSGDVTLSWAHRLRTSGTAIIQQDAASVSDPIEGTYTVEVLIAGAVIRTVTAISGTSFTYTHAQRVADDADLTKGVQFRITPIYGTLSGAARTTDAFLMS